MGGGGGRKPCSRPSPTLCTRGSTATGQVPAASEAALAGAKLQWGREGPWGDGSPRNLMLVSLPYAILGTVCWQGKQLEEETRNGESKE